MKLHHLFILVMVAIEIGTIYNWESPKKQVCHYGAIETGVGTEVCKPKPSCKGKVNRKKCSKLQ